MARCKSGLLALTLVLSSASGKAHVGRSEQVELGLKVEDRRVIGGYQLTLPLVNRLCGLALKPGQAPDPKQQKLVYNCLQSPLDQRILLQTSGQDMPGSLAAIMWMVSSDQLSASVHRKLILQAGEHDLLEVLKTYVLPSEESNLVIKVDFPELAQTSTQTKALLIQQGQETKRPDIKQGRLNFQLTRKSASAPPKQDTWHRIWPWLILLLTISGLLLLGRKKLSRY